MGVQRRGFVREASAGLAALAVGGLPHARRTAAPEPWLEGLNGKHKQYFDVAVHGAGAPLGRANNFLNAYNEAYGLKDADLNVVFGAHGTALPLLLDDAFWQKYDLGKHYGIDDPRTKQVASRNVFSGSAADSFEPSVTSLQRRGVRFLACRQTIARVSRELAAKQSMQAAAVAEEIVASLLKGVTPVPAAIVAVNRAQEAGLTYVYLG